MIFYLDRLCGMPWEHRFGLPIDIMYSEMHIHDTLFSGFKNHTCGTKYSPAIAVNPTQVDEQATLVMSGITWSGATSGHMDSIAKFGVETGGQCAIDQPCMGHEMIVMNDLDGSVLGTGTGGQILYNNPEYVAPWPYCTTASEFGLGFISCPNQLEDGSSGDGFKVYSAHWRDYTTQLLGPIKEYRYFPAANETRVFANYGKSSYSYLFSLH